MGELRRFRVSASYIRGTVRREAELAAAGPRAAAVAAVWQGLLPMTFNRGLGQPEPVYCNPNHSWPEVTDVAVGEDTATIAFSWGIQDSPIYLLVRVAPADA